MLAATSCCRFPSRSMYCSNLEASGSSTTAYLHLTNHLPNCTSSWFFVALGGRILALPRWLTIDDTTLMQEIRAFPVDNGSVVFWWLGQNGYIFKTPEGTLLSTDMYLTNNCADIYKDAVVDLSRRVPILIAPEELDVDIYA